MHLYLVFGFSLLLFLRDQITVKKFALVDLGVDVLLLVLDSLLHHVLLFDVLFEVNIDLLLAHA